MNYKIVFIGSTPLPQKPTANRQQLTTNSYCSYPILIDIP